MNVDGTRYGRHSRTRSERKNARLTANQAGVSKSDTSLVACIVKLDEVANQGSQRPRSIASSIIPSVSDRPPNVSRASVLNGDLTTVARNDPMPSFADG